MNDPLNNKLSDEIIDANLLAVFIRSHQNDLPSGLMPSTRNYPPTNETMMAIPPTEREWKESNRQQVDMQQVTPPYTNLHQAIMPSSSLSDNRDEGGDSIAAITFKAEWDDELDVSVIIDNTLSLKYAGWRSIRRFGTVRDDNR